MPEINIPPGVVKTLSEAAAVGRFIDTDKVRFVNGKPQKIGGWQKINDTPLTGIPRSIHCYLAPSTLEMKIVGTHMKLYALDFEETIENITPYRSEVTLTDPFTTTNGSDIVEVEDVAHGARQGDTVVFSGASAVGGITVVGSFEILQVIDDDTYYIVHSSTASSGATGGGTVAAKYEVSIGVTDVAEGKGYGMGPYGMEAYGTQRSGTSFLIDPRFWSLDNYGNLGLFSYNTGTIYTWDEDTDPRAVALSGAPTNVRYAFVTAERFIFALCDDLTLRWPDRDDPTDWTPTANNTANIRPIGSGTKLVAGTKLSTVSLIWTDTACYSAQYIGGNSIYRTDLIGETCGLVGPGAFCKETGTVYWFGCNSFHMYAGGMIQPIPNQDDILQWMLNNLNTQARSKIVSGFNTKFREAWWWFPLRDDLGGTGENGLYVAVGVDRRDGFLPFQWFHGVMARSAASARVVKGRNPLLASADGYLYDHELRGDYNEDGAAMDWHYQTGLWRIPEAKQSVEIHGFTPDFEQQEGDIDLLVEARDKPQSTDGDSESAVLTAETELQDLYVEGRFFQYRLSQTGVVDGFFRDGTHSLEVLPGAKRR